MVGTATVKHPCYYGIGNLVSWVEWKRRPFFAPCGFPSQIRCRHRDRKTDTVVLWYCETPSASEGSSNFLSFFISVEFLSSLMYLTCVWQRWLCAIGVDASCSLPQLRVFFRIGMYVFVSVGALHTHTVWRHFCACVHSLCTVTKADCNIFMCTSTVDRCQNMDLYRLSAAGILKHTQGYTHRHIHIQH